jgi:hypothetical protein
MTSLHRELQLRCLRPPFGDGRFTGDAWIIDQGDGILALRLGDYELARIAGLSFDAPSLNQMLDRIWSRRGLRRR